MTSLLATVIIILVCILVAWMLTFSLLSYKYPYESKYRKWSLILPLKDKLFGKSYFSGGDYNFGNATNKGSDWSDYDYKEYNSNNADADADTDDDVF